MLSKSATASPLVGKLSAQQTEGGHIARKKLLAEAPHHPFGEPPRKRGSGDVDAFAFGNKLHSYSTKLARNGMAAQ
jgi:hypothetical protein